MPDNEKRMLIINPNAGKGTGYRLAPIVERLFHEKGWRCSSSFTYGVKHAISLSRAAVLKGYKTIVAVGGDGTINEVVNGMADKPGIRLGIVSIGTGNDYIKAVNIPKDIEEAVNVIIQGKTRMVDIGQVEDIYFVNGLGIGFDAQVAEDLHKIKFLKGFPAYLYTVLKNLFFFGNPEIELTFDKKYVKRKTMMVSVMLGTYLGGGFHLTPDARIDDGMFDILSLGDFNLAQRLFHLPKVTKGTHLKVKGVELYHSKNITIASADKLKVHIDGEMAKINSHYFTIRLLKQSLNLIVP